MQLICPHNCPAASLHRCLLQRGSAQERAPLPRRAANPVDQPSSTVTNSNKLRSCAAHCQSNALVADAVAAAHRLAKAAAPGSLAVDAGSVAGVQRCSSFSAYLHRTMLVVHPLHSLPPRWASRIAAATLPPPVTTGAPHLLQHRGQRALDVSMK